jgi:hypothetical protein
MKPIHFRAAVSAAILAGVAIAGCGGGPGDQPDLGYVEGTVKLDGKPLAGAKIYFQPEKGRMSEGKTDANGHYVLEYTTDTQGAKLGKHSVRISTFEENDDGGTKTPEKVPAKYNINTTLTAEVKAEDQEIDFLELKSDGEIIQPNADDDE